MSGKPRRAAAQKALNMVAQMAKNEAPKPRGGGKAPSVDPKKLKSAYLQVVQDNINTNKKDPVLYFVYEYLRYVSATAFRRRFKGILGQVGTNINMDIVTNDVNKFIQLFRNEQYARPLTSVNRPIDLNFNEQTLARYFFLMWLDSIHDETYKKTFNEYLDFVGIPREISNVVKRVIQNDPIKDINGIKETNNGNYSANKGTFEEPLKRSLATYFKSASDGGISVPNDTNIIRSMRNRGYETMSILLDMEVNQDITSFVRTNREFIASKITVANIMDPGVYMLSGIGFTDEVKQFLSLPTNAPQLRNQYILNNYTFNFNYGEKTFMSVYSQFNPDLNPVDFNESRAIMLFMKMANGKPINITPAKKVKEGTQLDVLNKYYGDCFQGMVVAGTNAVRTVNKSSKWFLGTGDGNFSAVYANICDVLGVPAKIVVDMGLQEKTIDIYGSGLTSLNGNRPQLPVMSNSRNVQQNNNMNNVTGGLNNRTIIPKNLTNIQVPDKTDKDRKLINKVLEIINNDRMLRGSFLRLKSDGTGSKKREFLKIIKSARSAKQLTTNIQKFLR